MNKSEVIDVDLGAYLTVQNDAKEFGFNVPCPFDPESYEAKCWTIGFNDWVADQYNTND